MNTTQGDRVRLVRPMEDGDPVPVGTEGTVTRVRNAGTEYEQVSVDWDNGRRLMLLPEDEYEVLS